MLPNQRIRFWMEQSNKCACRYVKNVFRKWAVIIRRASGRQEVEVINLLKLNIRQYRWSIGQIVARWPKWARLAVLKRQNNLQKLLIQTYRNLKGAKLIFKVREIQMLLRFKLILKVFRAESNRLPASGPGPCLRNLVSMRFRRQNLNHNCKDWWEVEIMDRLLPEWASVALRNGTDSHWARKMEIVSSQERSKDELSRTISITLRKAPKVKIYPPNNHKIKPIYQPHPS